MILVVVSGCESAPSPEYDKELTDALLEVRSQSQPVRLAELTSFPWDTVYIFEPYVDGEFINTTIGNDLVSEDYQHSSDAENAVIFVDEGALAYAASVQRVGIGPGSGRRVVAASSGSWLIPEGDALDLVEKRPDA